MNQDRLRDVAAAIEASGRIQFGDVKRLERDVLPDGVTCREEAEILIRLDRAAGRADRAWGAWFVAVLVDYVVWSERPTGIVNEEAAAWLSAALDVPSPTRNARRLIDAIVAEAVTAEALRSNDHLPDAAPLPALAASARPPAPPASLAA